MQNSFVTDGCEVDGELEFSILFENVKVEEGAKIMDSLVMPGAVIKKGAEVKYAVVGENAVIGENAIIGASPEEYDGEWGVAVVGPNAKIEQGGKVKPQEMIYADGKESM